MKIRDKKVRVRKVWTVMIVGGFLLLVIGAAAMVAMLFYTAYLKTGHPLPQEKTIEGHYVYYLSSVQLWGDFLMTRDIEGEPVVVVDIEKNLEVIVGTEYGGTVLVVKHWADNIIDNADSAELIVRSEENKKRWEEAIKESIEKYKGNLRYRDILPHGWLA